MSKISEINGDPHCSNVKIPYAKYADDHLRLYEKIVTDENRAKDAQIVDRWWPMIMHIECLSEDDKRILLARNFEDAAKHGIEIPSFFKDLAYEYADNISQLKNKDVIKITDSPKKDKECETIRTPIKTSEMVSHPSHYTVSDKTYEPYKVIAAWDCDFNIGSAIKYLARFKKKWNPIEDLKKAKQYIDFEIEKLENESRNNEKDKQ